MPFTFSHPAAVLPLKRLPYLSFPGLLAGSIAPDFEYFMRFKSMLSHSMKGLVSFNLPMGVFIFLIFFVIIRTPLIESLPRFLQERLSTVKDFDYKSHLYHSWHILIISVLIGAATHILWDSFTHRTGYFVEHFEILNRGITDTFPVYRLLQHLSTIAGGLILAVYVMRLPRRQVEGGFKPLFWCLCGIFTGGMSLAIIWIKHNFILWYIAIFTVLSFLCAVTLTSLIYSIKSTEK